MTFSNNNDDDETNPFEQAWEKDVSADDDLKDVEEYVEEYD